MTRPALPLCVFALAVALGLQGRAQEPLPGSRSAIDLVNSLSLLSTPAARSDLNLSPEQEAAIGKLFRDYTEATAEKIRALKDKPPEEQIQAARTITQEAAEDAFRRVEGILEPEQFRRFQQINLQMKGHQAFLDPGVQEALRLTDAQKAEIAAIRDRFQQKLREFRGTTPAERRAASPQLVEARNRADADAMALLTDAQKEAWAELAGREFLKPTPGDRVIGP